jgi:hypothetical protein
MQMPPEGRIPVDRAIQILSFKKAGSPKDQDRIRRILDPAAVGSIPPAQLVRFLQQLRAFQKCVIQWLDRYLTSHECLKASMMRSTALLCSSSRSMPHQAAPSFIDARPPHPSSWQPSLQKALRDFWPFCSAKSCRYFMLCAYYAPSQKLCSAIPIPYFSEARPVSAQSDAALQINRQQTTCRRDHFILTLITLVLFWRAIGEL